MGKLDLVLRMRADVARAQSALTRVNKTMKNTGATAGRSAKKASAGFSQLGKILGGLGMAGGIGAITLQVRQAIQEFSNFDKAMREVATVSQLTDDQFKDLRRSLSDIAVETATDKIELAGAAYEVFSRLTKDANEVLFNTKIAAQAARAGMTDARVAAKLIAGQVNTFGITATEAFDGLFTAVDKGGVTFEGMAQTLGRLSPIASKVGVSFDEMLAALAFITAGGVGEDIAVTSLRSALNAIISPSEKFKAITQDLRIDLGYQTVKTLGLAGAIDVLTKVYQKDKKAVVDLIPESRAMVATLALAGDKSGKFGEILAAQRNKAGAGMAAFEKTIGGISASTDKMTTSFGNLRDVFVELGETKIANAFTTTSENLQQVTKWVRNNEQTFNRVSKWKRLLTGFATLGVSELWGFAATPTADFREPAEAREQARRSRQNLSDMGVITRPGRGALVAGAVDFDHPIQIVVHGDYVAHSQDAADIQMGQ